MKEINKHAAIITVDQDLILTWLQFEGGAIRNVYFRHDEVDGAICLVIEHPDLPLVQYQGEKLQEITPQYTISYAGAAISKIERTDPPKLHFITPWINGSTGKEYDYHPD